MLSFNYSMSVVLMHFCLSIDNMFLYTCLYFEKYCQIIAIMDSMQQSKGNIYKDRKIISKN